MTVIKQSVYPRNTIGVPRVVQLLKGAARSGVDIPQLLASCGIERRLLDDPETRIDRDTFIHLLVMIMKETEDEFVGLGQGLRSKPGTFSMMAHAVINCSSLGKAIQRGIRFYDMFDLHMSSQLIVRDGTASIISHASNRLDFREVILESLFMLTRQFMSWLVGQQLTLLRVEFDFPNPHDDTEALFDCPLIFSAKSNRIVFSADYLDLPLAQNELSLSRFLKNSLTELMKSDQRQMGLAAQIRVLLSKEYGYNFPDFSDVCDSLNMTPQTLRRRLKDTGTSYQRIKDAIREEASMHYLSKPELSIDEIALLMGFSEASSFHRAFKKWTGKTPSAFRQGLGGE